MRKSIVSGGLFQRLENVGNAAEDFVNLRLVDDLLYDDRKYQQLCNLLQKLVLNIKPSASLKCSDVAGCETVGDVVDLIGKTINGD